VRFCALPQGAGPTKLERYGEEVILALAGSSAAGSS
jgi:hypothetical protein